MESSSMNIRLKFKPIENYLYFEICQFTVAHVFIQRPCSCFLTWRAFSVGILGRWITTVTCQNNATNTKKFFPLIEIFVGSTSRRSCTYSIINCACIYFNIILVCFMIISFLALSMHISV